MINKFSTLFLFILIALLSSTCRSQTNDLAACKENYRQAHDAWAGFYQHSDTDLLRKALPLFRASMACDETKRKAITMTISLLSLLKQYQPAYLFVDSLNTGDFERPYVKKMDLYFFKSKFSESRNDLRLRDLYLDSAIQSADAYLRLKTEFDKESFADLSFLQSQLPTLDRLNHTVDSFKLKFPAQASFIEACRHVESDSTVIELPK